MSAEAKNLDSQEDEYDLTNKLADQSKHLQFLRKQMVQIKRQLKNQKSMRDESQLRRDQQVSIEQEEHWLELGRLNDLLTIEKQRVDSEKTARIQLQTELEKSKCQLDKVNTARENYVKKEEEMSIMLQRLQEQSEILHTSTEHQMVEMKKKEEKLIQEVREAQHMMARLTEELQGEKNLNLVLRQQLETLTVSHVELSQECETAVHQSDALKQKLEIVLNSHAEKVEKDEQLIQQLQAEQEELRRAMEVQLCTAHQAMFELERVDEKKEATFLPGLSEEQQSLEKCTDESQQEETNLFLRELERFSIEYQLEMLKKSHEKQTTYDQLLIKKLRTEQEELKKRIKELMSQAEPLEQQGDQEVHEQDADCETSREDRHPYLQIQQEVSSQAEDALEDPTPAILHEGSEAKQLLPPVHRSMRRIRRFLGLRRKRQKTPTY
ncbi:trichohyalin-like [Synchiropus splendidus]|uniref:trichohyalin-like n=1 Tax=Synchiropus splendidus TaxID=270530 RepID=UPI00237E360B|nr:trichohyalin-like [Synchiropus splendidus]